MGGGEIGPVDLFGMPVSVLVRGRGRPAHEPCEKKRRRVSMLMALGWKDARIAAVLGISLPTLRKHYFAELKLRAIARDALEARKFELLWEQAEKGNVGAIKRLDEMLRDQDRIEAARRLRLDDDDETDSDGMPGDRSARPADRAGVTGAKTPARPASAAPRGKKEIAVDAAETLLAHDDLLNPERVVRH